MNKFIRMISDTHSIMKSHIHLAAFLLLYSLMAMPARAQNAPNPVVAECPYIEFEPDAAVKNADKTDPVDPEMEYQLYKGAEEAVIKITRKAKWATVNGVRKDIYAKASAVLIIKDDTGAEAFNESIDEDAAWTDDGSSEPASYKLEISGAPADKLVMPYTMKLTEIELNTPAEDEDYVEESSCEDSAGITYGLGGCSSCTECDDEPEPGSVHYKMSVGTANNGDSVSFLIYHSQSIQNPGVSSLRMAQAPGYDVTYVNGKITSVKSATIEATISNFSSPTDPAAFKVDFRHRSGTVSSPVFKTTTFENIINNGETILRINVTKDGTPKTYDFSEVEDPTGKYDDVIRMTSGGGLKRETRMKGVLEDGSGRLERHKVENRRSDGLYDTLSDIEDVFESIPGNERRIRQVIDPGLSALVTTWEYYQYGEQTGPNGSSVGVGRLKSMTRYDGYQETYYYELNKDITVAPYAGDAQGLTTIVERDPINKTTTTTRTVNGNIISKSVQIYGVDSMTSRRYVDASNYLDTVTEYYSVSHPFKRQPKKTINPDGTVVIHEYSVSGGSKVTTTYQGVPDGSTISEGTRTDTTTNAQGEMESQVTTAVGTGSGVVLSHVVVWGSDDYGRPLNTGHFPDGNGGYAFTTSKTYSCCGVATETDQYGITTTYDYDDLKRVVKSSRLGVTTATVYDGHTVSTHRYPESTTGAPTEDNLISKTVTNTAGTVSQSWSRSAADGSLIRDSLTTTTYLPSAPPVLNGNVPNIALSGDLGSLTVTTTPDNFSQYEYSYLDGSRALSVGELAPDMIYLRSTNATGITETSAYYDNDGPVGSEITTTQSDWAGRNLRVTYMDGAFATMHYNSKGQMVRAVDPDGVVTLHTYNAKGERTTTATDLFPVANYNEEADNIAYGTDTVRSSVTVPATGTIAGVSGPVWKTVSKVWQPGDNDPDGGTIVSTSLRSADGLRSSTQSLGVSNPATSVTTLSGGGNWNTVTTSPYNTTTTDTYVAGLLEVSENKESNGAAVFSITYGYDLLNRPYEQLDSRLAPSNVPMDVPEFSYSHTTTSYLSDTADVVKSITVPRVGSTAARTTYFTYDTRGRRISVNAPDTVDADGAPLTNVTNTTYNPDGTVQETSGAQTYRTTHTYDYAQRQVTMTTYGTETAATIWKYSPERGFLTEKIHPGEINNGTASADYSYTNAGRRLTRTWERGVTTTYGYDGGGRQTSTDYGDTTPDVSTTYDALNRPDVVTSGDATWDYEYDPITLRLLSETHPLGGTSTERVLTRSYDNLSRPDGFDLGTPADPDIDHSVSYGFDDAGRYDNVTGVGKSFGYTYTAGDLIDTVTGPTHTVINIWDKPRRTIYSKNNEIDSVSVSKYTYGVNHIGQRDTVATTGTAFGNTNRGWAWGYDSLGQATKAVNAADTALNRAYGFDGIGNRTIATDGSGGSATTIGYTPNALNQYEAINPGTEANPTYDADGNLRNDAGINALTYGLKYEWDAENRLIAIHKADDTLIATYTYDPMGRRIRKTTTAAAYSVGATDTAYLYDGWNVVAEYSISNNQSSISQAYTWGIDLSGSMQGAGGVGGLLSIHRGPGTDGNGDRTWTDTFYPTYDGNGNLSEYLDKDGDEVAHFEYDPFGRLVSTTGTPADFTYRFSTKPQDFETGLYYYGYRYYDPETGRWPSRDPIEESGGINLYGFVGNDGVDNWDSFGLKTCRTRRGIARFRVDKLPSWFPANFSGEIGLRHAYEECDDGTNKMYIEFYGQARAQGPVRLGAIPLGTKGGRGFQMTFSLLASGSITLNYCNDRLDGFDVGAKFEVWGGLAVDALVASASAEVGGDFRVYFGSSDASGAVYVRADAAFKARGRYSIGYGILAYDDSFMFVARSPAFNLLEIRASSVTVAGFKFD